MQYTKGEWEVTAGEKYVHEPNNLGLEARSGEIIPAEVLANSRLIAAAPDLFDALKKAEGYFDRMNGAYGYDGHLCIFCQSRKYDGHGIIHDDDCIISLSRKALAKAEGAK